MGLATNPPRRLRLVLASALLLHTTSNISSPSGNASFVLGAPADADNFAAKDGNNDGTLYTEDLSLQRLGAHHVAARFVFRSQWTPREVHRCQDHEDWEGEKEGGRGKLCHFEAVFPRAFGVLLDRFQVRDLSLRMSKGQWDTTAWGNGPADGASGEYTAGGAEMWARLPSDGAWESWVGLRRSLSGVYCSSLEGMDETRVHTPAVMVMPGEASESSLNGTTLLRGILPRETVCTENLIPLVKMLPCRSKTGLGRLLHPTRLFQSDYHSISVRATATFSEGEKEGVAATGTITSLSLEQTVLAVFRPRPHLPKAVTERPSDAFKDRKESDGDGGDDDDDDKVAATEDWSVSSLLVPETARPLLLEACPVAARSAIHVLGAIAGQGKGTAPRAPPSMFYPAISGDESPHDGGCGADSVIGKPEVEAAGGEEDAAGEEARPSVVTRLLTMVAPEESGSGKKKKKEKASGKSPGSSIAEFLLAKLWSGGDGERPSESGLAEGGASWGVGGGGTAAHEGAAEASSEAPVARLDHFLAGRGGTRGVSVAHLVNMHPTMDAYVEFLQPVPYFLVPLLGTMRARLVPSCSFSGGGGGDGGGSENRPPSDQLRAPSENASALRASDDREQRCRGEGRGGVGDEPAGPLLNLAQNLTLTPGEGRRQAIVEARLWVPAASTLVLGFDFFKRFLTVDDFPPDPSRGFDVPPPLARFVFADGEAGAGVGGCHEGRERGGAASCGSGGAVAEGCLGPRGGGGEKGRVVYAYGEAGLLDTPQPDFSMPFNVITFTSTAITFFLGTAINLLVRKSASGRRGKKKGGASGGGGQAGEGGEGGPKDEERDGGSGGLRCRLGRLRDSVRGGFGLGSMWSRKDGTVAPTVDRIRDGSDASKEN